MKITAVTTFHQEGMLTYGQRLIDSWQEKVDPKIKLDTILVKLKRPILK